MFSGKPGCGKTSTIKAIAKYTKRHIIDVPLTKIDNCRDLMNIFYGEEINGKKIPMNKRIYLFEDIDTIIDILKEREVKEKDSSANQVVNADKEEKAMLLQALMSKKGVANSEKSKNNSADKLNLGFFLNLIDGVLETPGRILIISTNYPEKLEERITNRPSRFDRRYYVAPPSREVRKAYLENKIGDNKIDINVEKWLDDTEDLSMSHLKELFISVVLLDNKYENAIEHLKGMKKTPRGKKQKEVGFKSY